MPKLEGPQDEPVIKVGGKKLSPHELGVKLENFVKRILQADGYTPKGPVRLKGKSSATVEIDIVSEKIYHGRKLKIAVECKNYTKPVPPEDVRNFIYKIRDVGFNQGLFVTNQTFSERAKQFAEDNGIWMWDGEGLKEKLFLSEIGRLGIGQSYKFSLATPPNVDFSTATRLDNIQNRDRVEVSSAKLIWKPYYVVSYRLDTSRIDPSKKLHKINDYGDCVINAIDGKVARFMNTETAGISPGLSLGEDDALAGQLRIEPIKNYEVRSADEYDVKKIDPSVNESQAKKIALSVILSRNTTEIEYEAESEDTLTEYELRKFPFVPKREEIILVVTRLVFVPKWEITFVSGRYEYFREVFASSGDMPVNTIAYCPEHRIREFFKIEFFRKKTIAVCEICGKALCNEHIHQCPVCRKWLGVEHSLKCKNCGRFFCEDHIIKVCHICNDPICEDCVIQCPICTQISCKKDMVKCERCGKTVCRECTKSFRKFFRTKFVCKKCVA